MKEAADELNQQASELEEAVRRRAYERYEERGRIDGHELEDWLEAEAQVLGSRDLARAA